jgi:hypothetical protein
MKLLFKILLSVVLGVLLTQFTANFKSYNFTDPQAGPQIITSTWGFPMNYGESIANVSITGEYTETKNEAAFITDCLFWSSLFFIVISALFMIKSLTILHILFSIFYIVLFTFGMCRSSACIDGGWLPWLIAYIIISVLLLYFLKRYIVKKDLNNGITIFIITAVLLGIMEFYIPSIRLFFN